MDEWKRLQVLDVWVTKLCKCLPRHIVIHDMVPIRGWVPEMGVSQIFVACDPWADDGKCRQALDVIIAKLCQNMLPEYDINDTM